ncbi:MAG TPA: hypothetical protein VHX88_01850 [Solirubrobacteraceae bacterium]|jgi:prolyl-tRNA synthetase|nr:hypothetical protein [Solirubrobacteraceae bacterium]
MTRLYEPPPTERAAPADAEALSHDLMVRAGLRTWLPARSCPQLAPLGDGAARAIGARLEELR